MLLAPYRTFPPKLPDSAARIVDWATSHHHLRMHGLIPAFCFAAPAAVLERWTFIHHFRDLLIATEAVRAGATLVTENAGHFARWRSLLASAGRTLKVFNPS
ncbi:MAG TPA: hypothetical protein VHA33_15680 [Candidatus Angelobacter sp.]|nr:hypothetical protein [Candidatus Angelobacter sp.]